jgi:hypothetical protein
MAKLLTVAALFAAASTTLVGCYNQRYPGERDPLPQAAVGSGSGGAVTAGADSRVPVTSGCDKRERRDCR